MARYDTALWARDTGLDGARLPPSVAAPAGDEPPSASPAPPTRPEAAGGELEEGLLSASRSRAKASTSRHSCLPALARSRRRRRLRARREAAEADRSGGPTKDWGGEPASEDAVPTRPSPLLLNTEEPGTVERQDALSESLDWGEAGEKEGASPGAQWELPDCPWASGARRRVPTALGAGDGGEEEGAGGTMPPADSKACRRSPRSRSAGDVYTRAERARPVGEEESASPSAIAKERPTKWEADGARAATEMVVSGST